MNWTPAQSAAIQDEGGTLLVSAAAGSGKTAVLVQRAVRLLANPERPVAADRLLIVTFTRAAAEELRERIDLALAAEEAKSRSVYLRRQRILLGRANICTIDAFCMQLLRQYFSELGIPPDFDKADEASVFALRAESLASVMEDMASDTDFCDFASLYGRARTDARAADAVMGLYDFLRSLPFFDTALDAICADWQGDAPLCETAWGAALLAEAAKLLQSAEMLCKTALSTVREETALAAYAPAFEEDIAFAVHMQELVQKGNWDAAALYAQYKPAALKPVRGYEGNLIDAVKAMRKKAKDLFEKLQNDIFICTEAEFVADRARSAPMVNALAKAVRLFAQRFYEAKLRGKILEYSDFEHLALRLLCDENGVKTKAAQTISARFEAVMVDEYQDTNALQALLYRCLANQDENNLFLVGDIKQSIYRFRLAEPAIFLQKKESFAPYESGTHPAVLHLGHNFRSANNVIDQINYCFSTVMSRAVGGVDYSTDERLYAGTQDAYDGGAASLLVVQGDTDAPAVAEKIAQMVQSGFAVREKNGAVRPCTYGDFCILLRTRQKFVQYTAALEERGVPVYADNAENCLQSPEVLPLLSLLRVIDNPAQDVHLAAVLLSPLFALTPDELMRVRAETPRGSLYAALLHSQSPYVKAFLHTLAHFRMLAQAVPCAELCDAIFEKTQYFAAVGAMKAGEARRANLRAFVAWVGVATAGAGGLSGFLRMLELMGDKAVAPASETPAIPANTVSVMTIHRSKGLEFPVCILADAAHGFNLRDIAQPVLFHAQLGLGLNLREADGDLYKTAAHRAIALAKREEAVSEEMRILYVALTRARDKLIIALPLENPQKQLADLAISLAGTHGASPALLGGAASFAPWLLTAALLHPDCDTLRGMTGVVLPVKDTNCRFEAEMIVPLDASTAPAEKELPAQPKPDAPLCEALLHAFSHQQQSAKTHLPRKVSVSALAHSGEEARTLSRPSFLFAGGLTAAERGTALHSFLQFADFAAAKANLEGEIERLVAGRYLAADIAKQLSRAAVQSFFSSPLFARIQSADSVLREYDFITALPAQDAFFEQQMPSPEDATREILVQGIADLVLIQNGVAELVDYKTDRGKTAEQLRQTYQKQLLLYRDALQKRLALPITACTIYSFALAAEITVPCVQRGKDLPC